jgi:hypothetical protein
LAQAAPVDGEYSAARSAMAASTVETGGGVVPSRWHDYALSSITPQFSWAVLPPTYYAPRVLDNYSGVIARAPLFQAQETATTHIAISVATGNVADTPSVLPDQAAHLVGVPQSGLQRTVVAPTLVHDWGSHGSLRLTGVLAYQRFASLGLGTASSDGWAPSATWLRESSYGAGARVDVGNALTDRLRWNAGYQSRVGMGAFASYRGVFADPGDFDIPASATADFSYALTPQFGLDVGVQRVMYSAITPFTSSNLPTRFLALLGDGASPVFAWRDLNVYSVGWTLRGADFGSVQLRYTTRQQPVPTSKLLENALAPATANDTISLGWSRAFGGRSNLSFAASYATSPYYLLMPSYLARSDGIASQFEFEGLWSLRF